MTDRGWPSGSDYMSALQASAACFASNELSSARSRLGLLGLPASASGQNAIVFPVDVDGRSWAVRCFTHPPEPDIRRRYESLAEHMASHPVASFVEARWRDKGIVVAGRSWPIVQMEWVEARPLHAIVAASVGDANALKDLAGGWRDVVSGLQAASVVHGDLQHGNVLVDAGGAIRLVDYDGVWVPGASTLAVTEVGHPNYQHPERVDQRIWHERVDTFSALVIYVAIRALASDSSLWRYHTGENLLLSVDDYWDPASSVLFRRLRASADADVVELTRLLEEWCGRSASLHVGFDQLLDKRSLPFAEAYRRARRGLSRGDVPWWEPATIGDGVATSGAGNGWNWDGEDDSGPANQPSVERRWPGIALAALCVVGVSVAGVAVARDAGWQSAKGQDITANATATSDEQTTPRTSPPAPTTVVPSDPYELAPSTEPGWEAFPSWFNRAAAASLATLSADDLARISKLWSVGCCWGAKIAVGNGIRSGVPTGAQDLGSAADAAVQSFGNQLWNAWGSQARYSYDDATRLAQQWRLGNDTIGAKLIIASRLVAGQPVE